ncbi:protein phosphatase [Lithospermum erythrorhizon]|uniref:protein-serine/threonine phosphatase n=1 Tax=Lithospermum erythrorhizon TaxID=34254 RepID=A0AAV3QU57_LITER
MGICNSSMKARNVNSLSRSDSKSADLSVKKRVSGDFTSFLSKLSGGGVAQEKDLFQTPGRLVGNGCSHVACLYTQQGKKGTNQDAMIVWEKFCSRSDTIFCGVFDGHGPHGHMVARKVRDTLPLMLRTEWEAAANGEHTSDHENGDAAGSTELDESQFIDNDSVEAPDPEVNEKVPEIHVPLKSSILKAFKLMDKELKLNPIIDCYCSGSTAVTMVKQGQDIIIGNIGDSRAVLATREADNSLMALQLTVDLKPNLPREAARIEKCKGRVFALQDEPEVSRVWLPYSDSPGLAMARAFGDFCLKDFGLISVPDVYYHQITNKDEFVILASDGVWDVLSNKEAVDIVASAPGRGTAARALVDCATRSWRLKYPTSKTDDCAVVCLFLEHTTSVDTASQVSLASNTSNELKTEKLVTLDRSSEIDDVLPSESSTLKRSGTTKDCSEIVPVDETEIEVSSVKTIGQSKRSLAECLSTAEDDEWSALEGITRVNSLLSLPRFLSIDKRSASWRKWF